MDSEFIYNTMVEKCPDNRKSLHYLKRYVNFILYCINKNEKLPEGVYTENHHILPRSKNFWPEYSSRRKYPWNICKLTERQHIIAHYILAKAVGGYMWYAVWAMTNGKGDFYRPTMSDIANSRMAENTRENYSRSVSQQMNDYWTEERRLEWSIRHSGEGNPFYGMEHTEEIKNHLSKINMGKTLSDTTKNKISESLIEFYENYCYPDERREKMRIAQTGVDNSFYGKTHSEESKRKISESNKGRVPWIKGRNHSEESKRKISESTRGICNNKDVTCPHCLKVGKSSGMGRWHFDNCIDNPNNENKVRKMSEVTKKKISIAKTGNPSSKKGVPDKTVVCPHCDISGGSSIMKRWHFDNCRNKS